MEEEQVEDPDWMPQRELVHGSANAVFKEEGNIEEVLFLFPHAAGVVFGDSGEQHAINNNKYRWAKQVQIAFSLELFLLETRHNISPVEDVNVSEDWNDYGEGAVDGQDKLEVSKGEQTDDTIVYDRTEIN